MRFEGRLGIIGYGDFSKVLIEHLSPYCEILVFSRSREEGDAGFGARFAGIEEVLSSQIIIPSIPAQFLEDFFTSNLELINPSALVVDVASVKIKPLEVLGRVLPKTCQLLGTHPMFGPASIAKNQGLTGLKCVVCPVRIDSEKEKTIVDFLRNEIGLRVIYKTADEHDREMAYVQGLSHFIGHTLDEMGIPDSDISTMAYDDLISLRNVQGGDSWDLFCSIVDENPYAREVQDQFVVSYLGVKDKLTKVC